VSANAAGVAIVGLACRFPGAPDYRTFWRNLCGGVESITALSDEELAAAGVPPGRLADPAYVKAAPLLPDIDLFDAGLFDYSPAEARLMDPQQRLLLEVAWEAFEDAGYRPQGAPRSVGVFVGAGGVVSSYLIDRLASSTELPGYTGSMAHIGNDKDFLSTRISHKLNLTGPSINVQTACSTSLVAVHLACQAILAGECDMALAGAAAVRVPQRVGYLSRQGDILSPDGHCRAFDAAAKGTIFGSGVGAVLLKELQTALADRDNIYAVIRGSAINNDGTDKVSYTASSLEGQAKAIIEAMSIADVSPDEINYVECHGTGTIVGDPLEIAALTHAFRGGTERCGFCAVGSVKTNIGHLEQSAGIAALIKTALMVKEGEIPASLNFRTANRKIDFSSTPFFVNTKCRPWPADRPRLAGVNSLGLGGTNAFLVLDQAPVSSARAKLEPPLNLFVLSAKSDASLLGLIERQLAELDGRPESECVDICLTLSAGRSHFARRFATVAGSVTELRAALAARLQGAVDDHAASESEGRRIGFLFSGQGSQHVNMGAELYQHEPVYRAIIDRCDALLADRLELPLRQVLFGNDADRIHETAYAQPALFAVQAALIELWRSWGIIPDMVLGHSVGEFAAAYCAGVYSLEDALSLIAERARLMQSLPASGAMAVIFADEGTVRAAVNKKKSGLLAVAALNAPTNTVISGERHAVAAVVSHFNAAGIRSQLLTVSHAFHSPLMRPVMREFERTASAAAAAPAKIPWVSTLSGTAVTEAVGAHYWRDHALQPVRFSEAIGRMCNLGATDFIEIGPGSTLLALGRQTMSAERQTWLGSLADQRDGDLKRILSSLGELYCRGHAIDWDGFNRPHPGQRLSLPTYPFDRRRYWLDDDLAGRAQGASAPSSSLAGSRLRSALPNAQFESVYSLARFAYLDDHRIHGMAVLPLTFGLRAVYDAALQHFGTASVVIANLQYREAMVLPESGDRTVQIIVSPVNEGSAEFQLVSIGSEPDALWRTHMVGMVRAEALEQADDQALPAFERDSFRGRAAVPIERYYATLNAVGLQYGPSFRGIQELQRGHDEILAHVVLPGHLTGASSSRLHPALLDACLHVYPGLIRAYQDFERLPAGARTHVPIGLERFRSIESDASDAWVHARRRNGPEDSDTVTVDISIYGMDGTVIASLEGLSVKQLPPEALAPATPATGKVDWLYQLQWMERPSLQLPASAVAESSRWLILADRGGIGAALGDLLTARGAACRLLYHDELVRPRKRPTYSPGELLQSFATLIAGLAEASPPLRGIVNLWALDLLGDCVDIAELDEAQKIGPGISTVLLRATIESCGRAETPPRIWLATRNAVSTPADLWPAEVTSAAVWGLGRSAALEHPQFWGGLLDIGASRDDAPSVPAAAVLQELLNGDGEDQVALRANKRFAARLARATPPRISAPAFDPVASYLITGGLGALGLELAKWLVTKRGAKNLILTSRRGPNDPNAASARRALAALGANPTVIKADVTRERDVRRLLGRIEKLYPPLKGIFHCAGLLDDGILMQMDWQKFSRVLAPKLAGGWLLDKLTRGIQLDQFVVFSSILSVTGSAGQANYAAANSFLDALVTRRRKEGLPALALNWGPWAVSGLATASGEKGRAIWRARGTEYISADIGQQAMDLLIGSEASQAAITITRWPDFLRQFATAPPLYRELHKDTGVMLRGAAVAGGDASVRSKMQEASPSARRELLIAFVRQQAMQTLGMTDEINVGRPLRELGLDSLMSVTLVNRLEAALGIRISAVKLIQGPSVAQIVDDILPDLGYGKEQSPGKSRSRRRNASRSWFVIADARPFPRARLFCFPFAGGGSAVYRDWSAAIDPAVEVVAIEPPGRLGRIEEKPISDIRKFTAALVGEMRPLLDRPFAFFGHCLGGLTMYETARRLIHSTKLRPMHLFVSGARPPDSIGDQGQFEQRLLEDLLRLVEFRMSRPVHAQPDEVFAEIIRHFNIPATDELLKDAKLRKLMLPTIRAEFRMASNYKFMRERPWEVPITCFAARGDSYVTRSHALGWGRFTNSRLQIHIRQGAHFAVIEDAGFIHDVINRELTSQLSH
jgi:acyl transferase domain-containing protein/surfactin synthase thioesterase subunit/acyl carrier protein